MSQRSDRVIYSNEPPLNFNTARDDASRPYCWREDFRRMLGRSVFLLALRRLGRGLHGLGVDTNLRGDWGRCLRRNCRRILKCEPTNLDGTQEVYQAREHGVELREVLLNAYVA